MSKTVSNGGQSSRPPGQPISRRRAAGHLGLGIGALAGGFALRARGAAAQGAPACHWGTFVRDQHLIDCLSYARDALVAYNLDVADDLIDGDGYWDGDYFVLGYNSEVEVVVVCVPREDGSTWIIVHACSTDSYTAELARNTIRSEIQRWVRID